MAGYRANITYTFCSVVGCDAVWFGRWLWTCESEGWIHLVLIVVCLTTLSVTPFAGGSLCGDRAGGS